MAHKPHKQLHVVMYADGSSLDNQNADNRRGGWAALLFIQKADDSFDTRPGAQKELSGSQDGATNQLMELVAIREGLKALLMDGLKVTIRTDSQNAINWLTGVWKPKKYPELVAEILGIIKKGNHDVNFEKVEAHSDNQYNNRADELAKAAAAQAQLA